MEPARIPDVASGELRNVDEFVSIVTHELRAPLSTMRGAALLLRDHHHELTAQSRAEFFEMLLGSVERLDRLVHDLVMISDMGGRRLRLDFQDLSLLESVRSAVDQLLAGDASRSIVVIGELELPLVVADDMRVGQIVMNLLSNAVKYSSPQSMVIATIVADGPHVRCSIHNDGEGITEEQRAQLFQPFSRFSRAAESTGLGLYIAKQLVEAMGGTIGVESQPGRSATFWFSLPAKRMGARRRARG